MNTISKINQKLSFFVMLALLGTSWLSFTEPAEAAPNAVPSTSAHFESATVERLLNPDGTLNLNNGLSGTLDLRGWNVTLDSKRGPILARRAGGSEPLPKLARDPHVPSGTFDPAVALVPTWQALPNRGLDGTVSALAVIGSDLYVGGSFTQTLDESVTNLNGIAKFSGGAWSALPHNGLNLSSLGSTVVALAVSGSDLYVGGNFTQTFDGAVINLNHIAKFSGGVWSALPNGGLGVPSNGVYSLVFSGSDLYVGGWFFQTGDGAVTNLGGIAKFSGGVWSALPHHGLDGVVYALAVSGSDLYVGGAFNHTADGVVPYLYDIAKFSGGAWSALPHHGLDSVVHALAVSGSELYVGGFFTQTGDFAVTNLSFIAKFSGGAWSALPNNGLNNFVLALAISGSDLYVGGQFTQSSDGTVTNLNRIAKFSGGAWSALPHHGLNGGYVSALAFSGSDLYVGGQLDLTADFAVHNLNQIAKLTMNSKLYLPLIKK